MQQRPADSEKELPVSSWQVWLSQLMGSWKAPDGSQKARQILEEMDYPSFASMLPYRQYCPESGLFINAATTGFLLECRPLSGANESITKSLDFFLRDKVPRRTPLTFLLLGSSGVRPLLDHGLADFSWQGRRAEEFNAITRAYYEQGALSGFANKKGYPLTLRNYRLFVCYAEETGHLTDARKVEINQISNRVEAGLASAGLWASRVNKQGLVSLVRELANFRHGNISPPGGQTTEFEPLNTECVDRSLRLMLHPDRIEQSLQAPGGGERERTRILNYMLEKNPEKPFALWQTGDNISNVTDPLCTVACPFVITLALEVQDQAATQREANRKFMSADKKANSPFAKFVPSVKRQAAEWGGLRESLSTNQDSLARFYYNITLFCEDREEVALNTEMTVLNTYRRNGLSMFMPEFMQLRNYLSVFPFMMGEGLWSDICRTNAIHRARASNVANLLPVVADNQVCRQGLPIPSYRNQLSFLNLFDRNAGLDTDNNNLSVTGTSGGGKSFLMQGVLRQVIDSGGLAWVFDMGDSYKGMCRNVGGVYLNALDLRFNPFANIVDIKESAENIRNLLVVLASPSGECDDTFMSLLLKAVERVWEKKKNEALIDDIVFWLRDALASPEYRETTTVRARMEEIIVGLDKYCKWGVYGEYFNSKKPSLDDSVRFSVLEMGELKNKPDLLAAVMFSMMIYVEQRMFLSDRQQCKVCLIDEAWKLLSKDNKRAEDFIENGYRTARKYNGAYITITQGIEDFDGKRASGAAKAAWANSSFKIVLRQNRDSFRKYCLENPDAFSAYEREVIEGFPAAREAHFSAFMLRYGGQVSFHRLLLDPISRVMFSSDGEDYDYREAGMAAGRDIHDIIMDLAVRKHPDEMQRLMAWTTKN
ncbi:type IV secretion system protein TraC [Salmonella enterica]|nr:type IV secretion system protein TraC [Salmonella enterica]EBV8440979.1 type IV secretion system protein TraC [Salmonella enterica subsp. enterica serovar Chester]EBX8913810.1 type IV secretion system protein TraC [Salmonella enterica subsp. enterica serovar Agoueve]EDV4423872.1 type IV secretion system protein TraC [Salmonella enterica subsp. enterica]EEB0571624.1 type IV secretion system protein TraC [Salmonella enterica subsp. enterica serovar Kintambo]